MFSLKNSKYGVASIFLFFSFLIVSNTFANGTWNNNNFINDSFWRTSPTNTQIKEAIFGNAGDTKTAYTQERSSNICSTGSINIVNVQNYAISGVNSLPQSLAANTIYVLSSGAYITNDQILYGGNCIAVIGRGIVKIYSNSGSIAAIIKSTARENIILSDVKIDGLGDGLGGIRYDGNYASGTSYGIYFYTTKNSNINSVSVYNNKYGMQIEKNENTVITNSLAYNNSAYGITFLTNTSPNYIHNTQVFNNNNVGFNISNSTGQILSNSQFYNNKFQGIVLSNAKNSIISNCMSYNNSRYGIRFQSNSSNNIINNSRFFNNSTTGAFLESGAGNKFYGSIKLFNNASSSLANTLVGGISAGAAGDAQVSGLGRSDGVVDTGLTVGYPYITNPKTNDGRDLISGTARSSTNRSNKFRTGIEFISFSYGTGIIKQTRAINYNGMTYGLSDLLYDTNKNISQISFVNSNPDQFVFSGITGVELNQVYTSNIITLGGMDAGTFENTIVSGSGVLFKNGTNIGTSGTGQNGDQFYIQMTSSSNYSTLNTGTLLIGTTSSDFLLTTKDQIIDNIPDVFSFSGVIDAELSQTYSSNTIMLTGMDTAAQISVSLSGSGVLFKNGTNIGTGGTGQNGDQFYIQITSSSNYNTTKTGTLLANTISSIYTVSTKIDTVFPIFTGIISGTTYNQPVSISFSDSNLSGATLNGSVYISGTTISTEGDYIFVVSDTAGNSTGATFRIAIPKTITITFDANISTGIVTKAPVKYNKNIAYGMVFDDGLDDGYQPAFKYLNGGQISGRNVNFIAPGLYSTDGAGNDVAFRGGYAWYSVNGAWSDLHINTPSYITWTQLRETYQNGWDLLNHGWSSSAYPTSGQLFSYPDNPPGTTGLDYAYEIRKNYEYVRDHIGISGVSLTHFILPSGDPAYTQPAWDQGYKSVSSQGTNNGSNGINIYETVDLNHFQMNRKYTTSQNSDFSNVNNDVDTLMTNSLNSTTRFWRQAFTHGVVFTGNNNGGMDFGLWQYLMDHISNVYGKKGSDNIRFAGPQEVYEYIATKQATNINTVVSGNQLIINLDTLSVPSDLRRRALSLLVTGANVNISSIDYQNGAFTYHSENKTSGLINLEMGDYYLTDRDPLDFSFAAITGANSNFVYTSNIVTMDGMSPGLNNIIYLSGAGSLYKNGVSVGTSSTGANGDAFYISITSASGSLATTKTELKIGTKSAGFSVGTKPVIIYSTTGTTNQDVISTLVLDDTGTIITNNGGSTSYIFTGNGSFTFTYIDQAGNTGSTVATVNNIDKTGIFGTINYSTTGITNGNVTATISLNKTGTITNNGGSTSYVFTGNGSFTFTYIDQAGNTGSTVATVNNIDKTGIFGTINYSTTGITNGNVTATISLNKTGTITNNGGSTSYVFTGNGSFTFTYIDQAGNTGSTVATVNNIDKTGIFGTINYSTTGITNGNVTATISLNKTGTITNNGGSTSYVFTGNGSFTFTYIDQAGNTGSTVATVNNIDKTGIFGTINYSTTGITNGNVTATISLNKTGTITNNGGSTSYVFTGNGSFTFTYIDQAGNTGSTVATVNNIDKTVSLPVLDVNTGVSKSEFTGGAVLLTGTTSTGATFGWTGEVIVYQSGTLDTYLSFLLSGTFIESSGRDSKIFAPTITLDTGMAQFGEIGVPSQDTSTMTRTIINTIKAGSDVSSLLISGTYFKIAYKIDTGASGNILQIIRSEDGNIRETNSPDTQCILDANKICTFYTNRLSYFATIKETIKQTNSGGGGGGGGSSGGGSSSNSTGSTSSTLGTQIINDQLAASDKPSPSILGSRYPKEINDAYLWAYGFDITTMVSIQRANIDGVLLRKDMAKMISNFAINILKKTPSTGANCIFSDTRGFTGETSNYISLSCKLGLMGYQADGKTTKPNFNPNAEVDRAQFGTILSRVLRGDKYNGGTKAIYFKKHLDALKTNGIMTKITTPFQQELRGYVMLMMMRSVK